MTPVVIGDATLYLGDCRDWLSAVPECFRVSAVITDPPYADEAHAAGDQQACRQARASAEEKEDRCAEGAAMSGSNSGSRREYVCAQCSKTFLKRRPATYCSQSCGVKSPGSRLARLIAIRARAKRLTMERTGGRKVSTNGYALLYIPEHPRATGGWVYEHVVVAEQVLGKSLPPGACVHHVNHNKTDNRKENLVICPSNSYHRQLHARQKRLGYVFA